MSKRSLGAAVTAMIVSFAPSMVACNESPDVSPGASSVASVAQALAAPTCPGARWVGVADRSMSCPPAPGFEVGRLIDDPEAPASLGQYCTYEWLGDPSAVGTLPSKHEGGATYASDAWLDRDCAVVASLSPASQVEAVVAPELAAAHRVQIEAPPLPVAGNTAVDISIVDTWPGGAEAGRSTHGLGMAGLVNDTACSSIGSVGPCPVRTLPRLALDRYGKNARRDDVHGGTYGYQSTIARAIYDAAAAPGPARKIINLSIGWEPTYDRSTAFPGKLSHAVESVRAALRYAACANALVIAAAGNTSGGQTPPAGPMSPARWEATPAPACAGASPRPLLYSAAGVDNRDERLPNARVGARPRLAAPSFVVPSTKTVGGVTERVGPFTGSSVSAAVVSAIAALVWNVDPGLSPAQVMATIGTSGEALAAPADYCLAPPCGAIRRVSVCRALAAAGAAVVCAPIAAGVGQNPSYDATTLAAIRAVRRANAASGALVSTKVAGCSLPILSSGAPSEKRSACPSEVLPNDLLSPMADPQPGSDPCPACAVQADSSSLFVELPVIDELTGGSAIAPQTLDIMLGGEVVERYDLGSAIDDVTLAPLRDGLAPGGFYHVALTLPPGSRVLTSGYDGASIVWTAPATYKTSIAVVSP